MAMDYTQLNSTTQEVIRPKLVDNIFNATPLLNRMRKKQTMVDGGEYIKQPIITAKKTATGWYSGYDTLLTNAIDSINAVTYNWAFAYCSMTLAKTDLLKNSGSSKVIDLMKAEQQIASKSLADTLTTSLLSASPAANALQSICTMVGTTTEFGGISSSDFSGWASSVDSSTTNAMTLGALQGKFGDCTIGTDQPTMIIGLQDLFDKYWQLLEVKPEFRVTADNNSGLKFNGADWLVDPNVPGSGSGTADNDLYFINENYVDFYTHPKDNFKIGEWKVPLNQNAMTALITWAGQLGTSNRRMHGAFLALNPAL